MSEDETAVVFAVLMLAAFISWALMFKVIKTFVPYDVSVGIMFLFLCGLMLFMGAITILAISGERGDK